MLRRKTRWRSNYQNLSYQGSQADADRFLRAIAQQNAMDNADFGTTMGGINALNQLGTQQQQTAQRALDYYWQQLTQLQNLLKLVNPGMNTSIQGPTTSTGTDHNRDQADRLGAPSFWAGWAWRPGRRR